MLTADAFGVLPPIARLTPDGGDVSLPLGLHGEGRRHREGRDRAEGDVQHLLRRAVPAAARPSRYATMLGETHRAASARASGWSTPAGRAAPYGVGQRMKIAHTRAMIRAALSGALDEVRVRTRSGVQPRRADELSRTCRPSVLQPAQHLGDAAAYDAQAREAGADVRRELQDVRGGRDARSARRWPANWH